MQLKQLLGDDDDAVSPVIGVILMVAITVILAAVIGTFVLGLGDQVSDTSPTASFTFDFDSGTVNDRCFSGTGTGGLQQSGSGNGELTITHDGGDSIDEARLSVTDDSGNSIDDLTDCDSITSGDELTAGSSIQPDIDNDDTIRVVFESSGGDSTSTLGQFAGPEA